MFSRIYISVHYKHEEFVVSENIFYEHIRRYNKSRFNPSYIMVGVVPSGDI